MVQNCNDQENLKYFMNLYFMKLVHAFETVALGPVQPFGLCDERHTKQRGRKCLKVKKNLVSRYFLWLEMIILSALGGA